MLLCQGINEGLPWCGVSVISSMLIADSGCRGFLVLCILTIRPKCYFILTSYSLCDMHVSWFCFALLTPLKRMMNLFQRGRRSCEEHVDRNYNYLLSTAENILTLLLCLLIYTPFSHNIMEFFLKV